MNDVSRLLSILEIPAKLKGREWEACCPIHIEKEPSFHIENETGRFYCFGCTKGGSIVRFVEILKNLNGREARDWLIANQILSEEVLEVNGIELDIPIPGAPNRFYLSPGCHFKELEKWPTPMRRYAESRGISSEQVKKWKLGYSLDGRLENRIVLPHLKLIEGEPTIVGYSARTTIGASPRYQTPDSKENPDMTVLFGEYWWGPNDYVVLTEGSLNALACERAGAKHIGALGGSPLAPKDSGNNRPVNVASYLLTILFKLSRFQLIILASDPDKAGDKLWEAIRPLGRHTKLSRVDIPDGSDANTLSTRVLKEKLRNAGMPN